MSGPVRAVRRAVVTVVGVTVLVAGLLMLLLPGPGLLGTAAGLAILATEYDWARRHVTHVRCRAHHVSQLAGASPRNTAFALAFGAGLVALGVGALLLPHVVPIGGAAVGAGMVAGGSAVTVGTALGYRERRLALRRQARAIHDPPGAEARH